MENFTSTYAEILTRIHQLDPVAYSTTRNYVNGSVSYLSPYISRGVISIRQITEALFARGYKNYETARFIQELTWREYFQRVWQNKKDLIEFDIKQHQTDVLHQQMIKNVAEAKTGITGVDRNIEKLYETGYMHNHVRLYTASITCNIAKAYWKEPAKWLYYHLLDGDLASNNCSWQWVAGAFSSKKYYCNQENINQFTGLSQIGTYLDKDYETLQNSDIPLELQDKTELSLTTVLPATALPAIDDNKPTLIYNSYNLDPMWRKDESVNRVLLLEKSHFDKYPVSEKVIQFILDISKNIKGIQLYCGEFNELQVLYKEKQRPAFVFKEHPAFSHYSGVVDQRDWIFEEIKDFYPSFSGYWKKCKRILDSR